MLQMLSNEKTAWQERAGILKALKAAGQGAIPNKDKRVTALNPEQTD